MDELIESTPTKLVLDKKVTTQEDDNVVDSDEDIDTGSRDESDNDSDSNSELDEKDETFFDIKVWEEIGKSLEDFTADDIVQLSFNSHQSCLQFYKMYARAKGFGIRRKHPITSKVDGHITSQLVWCNKKGFRAERHLERSDRKRREKAITRTGCKALINFKWEFKTDTWKVTRFHEDHNHELVVEDQVPFVRSLREISEADRIRIKSLIESGVRPSITMRNMADVAGGRYKIGFLKSDLYNTFEKFKRDEIHDSDTETVLAYLLGKKSTDPAFFLRVTRDETNGIDKMFWCDGICRKNYRAFGTVIAFDTTYKVNAYRKPLVVIVGVNHHRKTVPFAVSLISNEKEETYTWVLQQLLEAGGNNAPYTVVTDGDKAMANAIKAVFPNAPHRLCLWHLMRNIKTNCNKRFCSGFMKCVDQCNTPTEFEDAWEELMTEYKVREHKWAKQLYENKEKWFEAFLNGHFFAGMRSTQRCESMNSTLKTVFTKKIMLYRFVLLYDKVLDNIRFEEEQDNYISSHTFPVIRGVFSEIKTHAAKTYTRNAYFLLCKEIEYESRHIVVRTEKDIQHCDVPTYTYWLNDYVRKSSMYIVMYNSSHHIMRCCCAKFDSIGFPCRHMFAVMKYKGMVEIPRGCIVRRWTMKAKAHLVDSLAKVDLNKKDDRKAVTGRYAYLLNLSSIICRIASTTHDQSKWLSEKLAKMQIKITKQKTTPQDKEANDKVMDDNGKRKGQGKGKGKGKGNIKGKEIGEYGNKKKKVVEEIEVDPEECLTNNDTNVDHLLGVANFGPGFSFVNLLKQFIPRSYETGEVRNAKDCYEVSVFEKSATVFDWEPKTNF